MRTSWKLRSLSGLTWSAYRTLSKAEVRAPPALPAGSGSEKLSTFETSAEVWESMQPEIMWTSAGIACSALERKLMGPIGLKRWTGAGASNVSQSLVVSLRHHGLA